MGFTHVKFGDEGETTHCGVVGFPGYGSSGAPLLRRRPVDEATRSPPGAAMEEADASASCVLWQSPG